MIHSLSSADIGTFSPEITNFYYIWIWIKLKIAFRYIFSNCFDYYWLSKSFFFNMVAILMISATLVTSGLWKNVICKYVNKVFDVIISVHYVSNKILLRDSNHIVHAVMWPKFDKCSISMRDVIIILFLQGFD